MAYGHYGDGGAYIIGSGSRALGPGYGAINLGYGQAGEEQTAQAPTAPGMPIPEHVVEFYNEQRGILFDDIQGRYEEGVDYAKDQYIAAMEQTLAQSQASMMAVVADAEKKLEKQQRMFLIGLAIAVSVPILLLRR